MAIPERIPGLRLALVLMALWGIVWMSLEGELTRVTLSAILVVALLLLVALERWLGGRQVALGRWLLLSTASGLLWGAGSVLMTLFLMALKTGIHAHGPEFTPLEIIWVWAQLGLWTALGGLIGAGLGMLAAAFAHR